MYDVNSITRGAGEAETVDAVVILLVLCAITCSTVQCFFNKLYSGAYQVECGDSSAVFSTLYGLIVGLIVLCVNRFTFSASAVTWTLGLLAGVSIFFFNLASINAAKRGPFAFQSIMMLFGSVLMALLASVFYWGETMRGTQLAGIGVMLAAFVALNSKGLNPRGARKGYMGWVAALFLSNGAYGVLMDAQQRLCHQAESNEMIIVCFLSASLISLLCLLLGKRREFFSGFRMGAKAARFMLISSTAAAGAVYLKMVLLGMISVSILYTVQNGGIMVSLAVLSTLVLKEKLSRGTVTGIALALISIVLLGL